MAESKLSPAGTHRHAEPPSAARLRSLARPAFGVRAFLKSVSIVEIVAIVGLLLIVGVVVTIYVARILPDQLQLLGLRSEVAANAKKIEGLQSEAGDPGAIAQAYQEIHDSLDTFRGQTLQPRTSGRIQIITLVNDLTRQSGVTLASAIAFEATDPIAEAEREAAEKTKRKSRKAASNEVRSYPSLRMTFTISGSYDEIRRFLASFESSRQFAIVDSVSISSSGDEEAEGGGRRGASRGEDEGAISLDISMTAYFQPDVPADAAAATVAVNTGAQ